MKKSRFILSILTVVIFIFTGCEKKITTEDVSKLTYYVTFELEGGDDLKIPAGNAFVDPGFTAMEGTTDVTNKVKVDGEVDGMVPGVYFLNYSAVNKDGFSASVTRRVIIYDPNAPATDISGYYVSNILRRRLDTGATGKRGPYPVWIEKLAPGFFYVSDFFGGWYQYGSGYGASYAMTGYIMINADNSLTYVSSFVNGWGDSLDDFYNGVYDPNSKGVVWSAQYAGFLEFNVTLTFDKEL